MRSKRIKRIRLPNTVSDDEGEPCMGVVSQITDLDNSAKKGARLKINHAPKNTLLFNRRQTIYTIP